MNNFEVDTTMNCIYFYFISIAEVAILYNLLMKCYLGIGFESLEVLEILGMG